jgi:SAM-dependent methyltransferase
MNLPYDPKEYWEHRLGNFFNYRGVGHIGFNESYNNWLYRRKKRCIESFFGDMILKGRYVLDVGCGTGFFIEWFIKRGANVCGIDITEVSIRKLEQLYSCEFFTQDITAPDYQPYREFDVVNMWDVVYHIVEPIAFDRAFDNIARSLNEGGLLLLTDWFGAGSDVRIAEHVQARCLDTYQHILPRKGFELVSVCPLYKTLNKQHLLGLDNHLG